MTERRSAPDREDDLRLPKPPGVIRQFFARHPRLSDGLLLAIYGIPGLAASIAGFFAESPLLGPLGPGAQLLAFLAGIAAIIVRRRMPLLGVALAAGAILVAFSFANQPVGMLPAIVAVYSSAVYRSVRAAWISWAVLSAATVAGAVAQQLWTGAALAFAPEADAAARIAAEYAGQGDPAIAWLNYSLPWVVFLLVATLVGVNVGNRKRYLDALVDRAAQLARERDQQAQIASAAERARIAREMHDIVAHGLTVIVSLSDGASAQLERDPARAREAVGRIGETGRRSLAEMRRLLGVLDPDKLDPDRTERPPELAPQPGIDRLFELVDGYRETGLEVRLELHGERSGDDGVQLAVYRIVQESLTNVLRHAQASAVTVRLDMTDTRVQVEVRDDGRGGGAGDAGNPGRGLAGLRERAALYGGTVTAGPAEGGGWCVHAVLTRDETGDDDAHDETTPDAGRAQEDE